MSLIEPNDFSNNSFEDEASDLLFETVQNIPKVTSSNTFLRRSNKTLFEDETTFGSHLNQSQIMNILGKSKEVCRGNTQEKSSMVTMTINDSFHNESLSNVSRIGSQILTSGRITDCSPISDKMSAEKMAYDDKSVKMSSRSLIHLEMKAVKFARLKAHEKIFKRLKQVTSAKKRLREISVKLFESEKQKEFINLIYDLKKIAGYRNMTNKRKSYRKQSSSNESVMNSTQESQTKYDSFFLLRKAFKILRMRAYYKSLSAKAEKFQYYKLLLKYMFKWIEYIRKLNGAAQGKLKEIQENKSISNYDRNYSQETYRLHSNLNHIIEEEKDPFTKFYEENLLQKMLNTLRNYSLKQKKKKNLEEVLIDSFETKYVFKPFRIWVYHTKYVKLRRKAILQIQKILSLASLRHTFNKIKKAASLITNVQVKRTPGVILKQSHLLQAQKRDNRSNDFSQNTRMHTRNQEKENHHDMRNKSAYLEDAGVPKQFRNYLYGLFPNQKKNKKVLEQDPNRSNSQIKESYQHSQSFVLPKSFMQNSNMDENNVSLNLDTSHFGGVNNSTNLDYSKQLNYLNDEKPQNVQTRVLDQSLFGLNVSKIEKENKSFEKSNQNKTLNIKNQSSFIQKNVQNSYYSSRREQKSVIIDRKQSPSPVPKSKSNKSFMILDKSLEIENKEAPSRSFEQHAKQNVVKRVIIDQKRSRSTQPTKNVVEDKNKTMNKATPISQRNKFKVMIDELNDHLKFLNRNLLNQKLINKKLVCIKKQLATEV